MASLKETPSHTYPKPLPHCSSGLTGLTTTKQTYTRTTSHSVLSNLLNSNHRISRRRSISNSVAPAATVTATLREADDQAMPLPIAINARRNTMNKHSVGGAGRSGFARSLPSPPASFPASKFVEGDGKLRPDEVAVEDDDDDPMELSGDEEEQPQQLEVIKTRARRASEGQTSMPAKESRKSSRPELRCEKCGKGYKHSSCLTKHLWEHTPEWSYTSKLLISKHQQVQLLEAASVLVAMNHSTGADAMATTPPDSAREYLSDRESDVSPDVSTYSDAHERSSTDTTPPPVSSDKASSVDASYQSTTAEHGWMNLGRRGLSCMKHSGEDDQDLASAVELLSCSFNSNGVGSHSHGGSSKSCQPVDVLPIPPVPAHYLDQMAFHETSFISSFPSRAPESFTRSMPQSFTRGSYHGDDDVIMGDHGGSTTDADEDDDMKLRARSDEDEIGVFGRMEE